MHHTVIIDVSKAAYLNIVCCSESEARVLGVAGLISMWELLGLGCRRIRLEGRRASLTKGN